VPDEAARVRAGHAAAEIEQVADDVNAEVIIVGSHPRGALRAAAADSVTRSLAAGGSRPVLFARPEGDVLRSTGPVVCGVDEGDDAERVAAVAARFASRLDRPLRLVHVGSDVGPLGAARGRPPEGVAVETALVGPGDVAERLRDHADASEAALIVVGCRGHGALRSVFGGSVSLALTNEAIQPVLVVPPRAR
jgi:nucleotide-binding universal stress UspA family protein